FNDHGQRGGELPELFRVISRGDQVGGLDDEAADRRAERGVADLGGGGHRVLLIKYATGERSTGSHFVRGLPFLRAKGWGVFENAGIFSPMTEVFATWTAKGWACSAGCCGWECRSTTR